VKHDRSSDLEPQASPPDPSESTFLPFNSPNSAETTTSSGKRLFDDEIRTRQRTGIHWIVASGLVLVFGLGGWYAYHTTLQPTLEPLRVATVPVEREDVEVTVTATGVVELGGQQTFKAPTDVTVESVAVQERQRVNAGEVLIVLRDRDLQRELSQAIVQAQQARNTYNREQERVEERQNRLARAQEQLQESQALLDQGFISEDEYRVDQNAVEDAESNLRDADVSLANAELGLRSLEAQVQTLRAQVADTRIVAPFDAVILNIDVNPGDGVQQEGQLLTIGDPTQETVRLQLLALDALRVRENMPARISMIGPNARTFTGRIVTVAPQAVSSDSNSGRNDPTRVEAQVRLDAPSQTLIPGSEVSIEIVLDSSRDAMTVPITAVQMDGSSPYVWIRDEEGTAQRRSVELGLQNVEQAEIRSGLTAGDEVVPVLPANAELIPDTPLISPDLPDAPEAEATP